MMTDFIIRSCARTHDSIGEQSALPILVPMSSRLPINTSLPGSTLIRFWCRTGAEPGIGHWSFSGWFAYHEEVQRIRHNITS
jgi:hypothetical protein